VIRAASHVPRSRPATLSRQRRSTPKRNPRKKNSSAIGATAQTNTPAPISAAVLLPVTWSYVLKDYQKQRITAFLNPDANILGSGWHAHHARVAIGNGGFSGLGFMRGTQNHYLFLPEQQSDFPFPVFAEDWGFVGALLARETQGRSLEQISEMPGLPAAGAPGGRLQEV